MSVCAFGESPLSNPAHILPSVSSGSFKIQQIPQDVQTVQTALLCYYINIIKAYPASLIPSMILCKLSALSFFHDEISHCGSPED